MSRAKDAKEGDRTQSERFIEAARELECDESEARFDAALRAIAKAKPKEAEGQKKRPPADQSTE